MLARISCSSQYVHAFSYFTLPSTLHPHIMSINYLNDCLEAGQNINPLPSRSVLVASFDLSV